MGLTIMSDGRLEAMLVDLGTEAVFPDTPPMVDAVLAGLMARPASGRRGRILRIAAAAAIIVLAVILALPGPRNAVADWLGLGGVLVTTVPELPASVTTGEPFGEEVSVAEALDAVEFPILLPEGYGDPSSVFLDRGVRGGQVTATYEADGDSTLIGETPLDGGTAGMVITEMAGSVEEPVLQKLAGTDTVIIAVDVNGSPGFWFEGAEHVVGVVDSSGRVIEDRARLVGNTLLFERGGVTIRIESGLQLPDAIAIAGQLKTLDP